MSEPYKLYQGDNLEVMRGLPSESIDLIYIDPPYFSQRNYGDFDDRWKSMQHYLDFMVERLKEMHRLLKQTGSIYVHLDWHAVHYVKVEMDKIFGVDNFQNEIVWCYPNGGKGKRSFARKHDTILWYSKSQEYLFNDQDVHIPYELISPKSVTPFNLVDKDGRRYRERVVNGKTYTYYEDKGKIPNDWWIDIQPLTGRHGRHEKENYQTQKPSKLMERIILASSNEGDLVADFFCGSGSFIKKAFELGRRCIGCDVSPKALALAHCPTPLALDGGDSAASEQFPTPEVLSTLQGESTPAHRK